MSQTGRQPPRFVPTLTEVVDTPLEPIEDGAVAPVIDTEKSIQFMPVAQVQTGLVAIDLVNEQVQDLSQQVMERVMARVDAVLEERLRYALADLVQLHTHALYQAMRAEVEDAVRTTVQEAVAQEQLPKSSS